MPLLLILFGLLAPRIVLIVTWFAGTFTGAWQTTIWPVLGFFFMPYTTLAYGIAMAYGGGLHGIWLIMLIIAVLFDMGTSGESARRSRRPRAAV